MLQESFKGVSRKIEVCFNSIFSGSHGYLREIQRGFKQLSRMFQGYFKKVSRVFQGRLRGVSRKFQRRSKEVPRVFKESVKCSHLRYADKADR